MARSLKSASAAAVDPKSRTAKVFASNVGVDAHTPSGVWSYMNSNEMTVSNYQLLARSGRPIRIATQVTYQGRTIQFMERMSKREAIRQAVKQF